MFVLLASLPILLTIILMVGLNWPAKKVMPLAWLTAVILAAAVWMMPAQWLAGATISGALSAFNILITLILVITRIPETIALVFAVGMVNIMRFSGNNASGMIEMLKTL